MIHHLLPRHYTFSNVAATNGLGALGFQRLEPFLHRLQVVAQPHTAHTGRGDREPALPQLVGNADLTEGRLLDRQRYDGILDLLRYAVLQHSCG
jgi:hypothetical protein